ncbi:MAG: serine hydrolase domain-containing protein [Sodaliphilus sp.]
MKKLTTLLMCLMLVAAAASAKPRKQLKKAKAINDSAFVADFSAMMDSLKVVGANVVVVKDNKIAYTHSFGLKSRELGEDMTPDAIFRIASISKSFAATAIMQLAEKGKIDLQGDVSQYLKFKVRNPKYPDVVITPEMLMSHTSSLNDTQGYWESFDSVDPSKNPDYAKCYNDYKPGTGYSYCNYGINILAAVVENVSGERFDRYVVKHIMKPLGLKGSHNVEDFDSTRFVTLYQMKDGVFVPQPQAYKRPAALHHYQMGESTVCFSGAGGVKISAPDLAKYMLMHMNYGKSPLSARRVLSTASARRMQTVITDDANANVGRLKERAGLGLVRTDEMTPGVDLVGHTGGAYGMIGAMFFNPEKKYGFVVLANSWGNIKVLQHSITLMYEHFIGPLPKK